MQSFKKYLVQREPYRRDAKASATTSCESCMMISASVFRFRRDICTLRPVLFAPSDVSCLSAVKSLIHKPCSGTRMQVCSFLTCLMRWNMCKFGNDNGHTCTHATRFKVLRGRSRVFRKRRCEMYFVQQVGMEEFEHWTENIDKN